MWGGQSSGDRSSGTGWASFDCWQAIVFISDTCRSCLIFCLVCWFLWLFPFGFVSLRKKSSPAKRQPLRALTKQETSVGSQSSLVLCLFAVLKAVGYRAGCIGTLVASLEAVAKCYSPEARRMAKKNECNSEAQLSDYLTNTGETVL